MIAQFAKESITLTVREDSQLTLRAAHAGDMENLRKWKNDQREFFFYKSEINPEQQAVWYEAYKYRPDDYMFMTVLDDQSFGCMGIRWLDDVWDIYNVILGQRDFGGRGLMSMGLKTMLAFAFSKKKGPISLQVLKHNPAVAWYLKNGFVVTMEHDDHYAMIYQSNWTKQGMS